MEEKECVGIESRIQGPTQGSLITQFQHNIIYKVKDMGYLTTEYHSRPTRFFLSKRCN